VPPPESLSTDELKAVIGTLTDEEVDVSDRRRVLHAQIDAYRKELVDRLRRRGGEVIEGRDDEDGGIGTREPRKPSSQHGGAGAALQEPRSGRGRERDGWGVP
jgi:hypothetical protein